MRATHEFIPFAPIVDLFPGTMGSQSAIKNESTFVCAFAFIYILIAQQGGLKDL
jgi:hypothetical protein